MVPVFQTVCGRGNSRSHSRNGGARGAGAGGGLADAESEQRHLFPQDDFAEGSKRQSQGGAGAVARYIATEGEDEIHIR